MNYDIVHLTTEELKVYTDANFADDRDIRRSTIGIIANFAGGPLSFKLLYQPLQLK